MNQADKYQPYVYLVLCFLLIGAHELVYVRVGRTTEFIVLMLVELGGLLASAALIHYLLVPSLERIASFRRRRLSWFVFDALLYLGVALGLLLLDAQFVGHRFGEVKDLALGVVVLGYFAVIDNALARQLHWFHTDQITVEGGFTVVPLAQKFSVVLTFTILITAITISLSAYHLLSGELVNADQLERLPQQFLVEVMFIFAAILALLLRLIHSYTRNIHAFLQGQMEVLQGIQEGRLDRRAPIMSQDELGLVAVQINAMIEHLRDRDRLHKTLEKVVGSNIMEKLLTTDDETLKRGQEDDVAIMFCDMRDFTSMSEASSSEEIIMFLNSFFSDLSEIVSRHNGTINKFMGDAVLAVYGLEGSGNPVEDAVDSSLEILEHTQQFILPDGTHPEMGAGIHYGTVVAGTIGSEQRYEYTFLGDAVNTASRLEGLTKRMKYRVIISSDAYEQLPEGGKRRFLDLGNQRVRGKNEPLHVFGTEEK